MAKSNHKADVEQIEPLSELTITFRKPIELTKDGEAYESMTLREPTAGDIDKVSALAKTNAFGSNMLLIELVSGLPKLVVARIPIRDLNEGLAYLLGFLPKDQETGEPS